MKPTLWAFWFCIALTAALVLTGQLLAAYFTSLIAILITLEGLYGKH